MTLREAYSILQINEGATAEEIKLAYKRQVKKYHPDIYGGDKKFAEERTKQINEAYRILTSKNEPVNRSSAYEYSEYEQQWAKLARELDEIFKKYQKEREELNRKTTKMLGIFIIWIYFTLLLTFIAMLLLSIKLGKVVSIVSLSVSIVLLIYLGIKVFVKVRKKTKKNKS